MKILHFSVSDKKGAFEATRRLHEAFRNQGHDSVIVVREKHTSDKDVIQYSSFSHVRRIRNLFTDAVIRSNRDYYFLNPHESVSFGDTDGLLSLFPYVPDVILLHWISRFINLNTVNEIQEKTGAKIFWLMLDMAPMTGGCHYAWQCRGYQKNCGNCPAIYSQSFHDISSNNFIAKQKYLRRINPIIVAPTNELYNQAIKSALFKKSIIHKILLPVDLNEFYPGHKSELRRRYNIPAGAKVLCFRSDNPNQKRKGFDYIVECLGYLNKIHIQNVHTVIIGKVSKPDLNRISFPSTIFSSLKNNSELGDVYRLSDVFLCTSIQDSGPMMINESIASGLPVVSFPVGVAKDLIISGKTGFIASLKDSKDLANKVDKVLSMNTHEYNDMVDVCRKLAMNKLSFHSVIKQYEQIL